MKFKRNDIMTHEGKTITVLDFLGEGGQGEVYLVDMEGARYALKIYKDHVSADFRYNLKNNIRKGSPSDEFLWPKVLLDFDDGDLGYMMDLRPKNYVSFVSYLTGKNTFDTKAVMIKWCITLCNAFKKLHEQGYSYQDLNDGSFFFDPHTGDLLICDNDNVTADKKNLGILGKMRYMAPEIVRGDKIRGGGVQLPDVHSDRFSLAVILFMALCLGNPFEGERLKNYDIVDEEAEYELFGKDPVFVYYDKKLLFTSDLTNGDGGEKRLNEEAGSLIKDVSFFIASDGARDGANSPDLVENISPRYVVISAAGGMQLPGGTYVSRQNMDNFKQLTSGKSSKKNGQTYLMSEIKNNKVSPVTGDIVFILIDPAGPSVEIQETAPQSIDFEETPTMVETDYYKNAA